MTGPTRIVLVGFMGCGKTTVGQLVARRLGWGFCDLDQEVEARAGRTVAEIFAREGEAAFRERERHAAEGLLSRERCVVATGGGAWVQDDTRASLQRDATSVWLDADLDTLARRLPDDGSRPLASSRERMRVMLAARQALYRLADIRVDAAPPPETVAQAVLEAVFPGCAPAGPEAGGTP